MSFWHRAEESGDLKRHADEFSGRLVDLFGEVPPEYLGDEIPEGDIAQMERQEEKHGLRHHWNRRKIAAVSGFAAAGSIALTGAVVLVCRKHSLTKGHTLA